MENAVQDFFDQRIDDTIVRLRREQEVYRNAEERLVELSQKLHNLMGEELQALLLEYEDCWTEKECLLNQQIYLAGIKDGIKLRKILEES